MGFKGEKHAAGRAARMGIYGRRRIKYHNKVRRLNFNYLYLSIIHEIKNTVPVDKTEYSNVTLK